MVKDKLFQEIKDIIYNKKLELEFKITHWFRETSWPEKKKIRVFVVEDNCAYQRVLSTILTKAGYIELVGMESTGKDAIKKIKKLPEIPDVVVTNIAMPVMDGIAMTKKLVSMYPDLKIVILSAFGDRGNVVQAFNAGVTAYLRKDAGMFLILKTIRNIARGLEPPCMDSIMIHLLEDLPADYILNLTGSLPENGIYCPKRYKIKLFIINHDINEREIYYEFFKNYSEFEFLGQTCSGFDAVREMEKRGFSPDFIIINGDNLEKIVSTVRILLYFNSSFKIILPGWLEEDNIPEFYRLDNIYLLQGDSTGEIADFIKKNAEVDFFFQPELLDMKNIIKSLKERKFEKKAWFKEIYYKKKKRKISGKWSIKNNSEGEEFLEDFNF